MNTKQGVSNRIHSKIDENPYEDLNTLIEQSARLYYSNRIYIALLGNPLDMPLASVSKSLINT